MAQSTHDAERKHHNIRQMLWYQEEETKHYWYMEINTQSIYAGCRISKGGEHSFWANYKQKYMEFLNVHQMSPGNYIFLVQRGPLDPPLRVDILGVDIWHSRYLGSRYFGPVDVLGVDIFGVDVLGVDISAPTHIYDGKFKTATCIFPLSKFCSKNVCPTGIWLRIG